VLGVGWAFGLRDLWKRRWGEPLGVILAGGSLFFFGALALRFAPAAWETGNRAGEFLFLGLSFVVAYGAAHFLGRGTVGFRLRAGLACLLGVVLVGGAISGWPWDIQLAKPVRITAEGREIVSEPLGFGEWAKDHLPGARFAAKDADARMLALPGGLVALSGQGPDIEDILGESGFPPWQRRILRNHKLRYVVADRRDVGEDNLRGISFTVPGLGNDSLAEPGVVHKFSRIGAARLYDSGRIVVFDLKDRP
jgi:hypothetical protein